MASTVLQVAQTISTAASVVSAGVDIRDCWSSDQSAHLTDLGRTVQTVVNGLFAAIQTGSLVCSICPVPNPVQITFLCLAGGMTVAKQAISFHIGKTSLAEATDTICRGSANALQMSAGDANCTEVAQIVSLLFSAALQISRYRSMFINIVSSDEPAPRGIYTHYDPDVQGIDLQQSLAYREVFDAITIADFNTIPALWRHDRILNKYKHPNSQQLMRYSTDLEVQREIDQRLNHLLKQTKDNPNIRKLPQSNTLFFCLTKLQVREKSASELEQALIANPKLHGLVSSIGVTAVHLTFKGDKSAREAYLIQANLFGVFKPGKYQSDLLSATAAILGSPFSQDYKALRIVAKNRHALRIYLAKDAACLSCDIGVASADSSSVYEKNPGKDDPIISWKKEVESSTEVATEKKLCANARLQGWVASLKVESRIHQFEGHGSHKDIYLIQAKPLSSTTSKSHRANLFSAALALLNKATSEQEYSALQTVMKSGHPLTICLAKDQSCYSIYTNSPLSITPPQEITWEAMKPAFANLLRGRTPAEIEKQICLTLSRIERCKGVVHSVQVERVDHQSNEDGATRSDYVIEVTPNTTFSLVRSKFDPFFAACALLGLDLDASYNALHGLAKNGEKLRICFSHDLEKHEIKVFPLARTASSVKVDCPGHDDPIIAWSQQILKQSEVEIETLLCSNVKLKGVVASLKVESRMHQIQEGGAYEEVYLIEARPLSSITVKPCHGDLFLAILALLGTTGSTQYDEALQAVMKSGQLLRLYLAKNQKRYSIQITSPNLNPPPQSFSWQEMQPVVETLFKEKTPEQVEKQICLRLSKMERCKGTIHSIRVEKIPHKFRGNTTAQPSFLIEAVPHTTFALFKSKPDLLLVAAPLFGFDLSEGCEALLSFAKNGERLKIYISADFQQHEIITAPMNPPSLPVSVVNPGENDPVVAWAKNTLSPQLSPIEIETQLCSNPQLKGLIASLKFESQYHQFQAEGPHREVYLIEARPLVSKGHSYQADVFLATLALLNKTTSKQAYNALTEVMQSGHLLKCYLAKDLSFYSIHTESMASKKTDSAEVDLLFKNLCHNKMANGRAIANTLKNHQSVKTIVVTQIPHRFEDSAEEIFARKIEVTLRSSVKEHRRIEINKLYSAARAVLQSQNPKDRQALSALARDTSCFQMWFSLDGSKKYELSYT